MRVRAGGRAALFVVAAASVAPWSLARAEDAKAAPEKVASGTKVSIEYTLVLDDGTEADTNVGGDPLVYEQGAHQILPALETALLGLAVNDTRKVVLAPKDGYGEVDPSVVKEVPIEQIPEEARKVDAMLMGVSADGRQMPVRVQKVGEKTVTLDLNHPLAGRTLTFDVKVLKIE